MSTFQTPRETVFGQQAPQPERTSALAVVSLVLGIVSAVFCCIGPITGFPGIITSVIALTVIGRSEGRLAGRGAAVGGLVCSIVGSLFGVALVIGASMSVQEAASNARVVTVIQSDDQSELKEILTAKTVQATTPESLAAFRNEMQGSLGRYQGVRAGLWQFARAIGRMKQIESTIPSKYVGNTSGLVCVPFGGMFEKGDGLILIVMDTREQSQLMKVGKIENIGVMPEGGPLMWFIDPASP